MKFLFPLMLWLLLIVPLVVALYLYVLRRKAGLAHRYRNMSMVREAMGSRSGASLRRHIPPAVYLCALVVLIVAVARPTAVLTLPSMRSLVVLAVDVSVSMRATDVAPDRITSAKEAARAFVLEQPSSTNIGIVAFAGTALLVRPPTQNHGEVIEAIDRLQIQRGTNIGDAILVSLNTIFPNLRFEVGPSDGASARERGMPLLGPGGAAPVNTPEVADVAPGSYENAAIILLTDGVSTAGPDPFEAAQVAAKRGVRIFVLGLGTKDGELVEFGGRKARVQLDEDLLKGIAEATRGRYFFAETAAELKKVYQQLDTQFLTERKETEITSYFAAVGALLAIAAAALSLTWYSRIL